MLELIGLKRTKRDTSVDTAMYQVTFECDRKGMGELLELMKTEQASEAYEYIITADQNSIAVKYDESTTTTFSQVITMTNTNNKPLFLFIGKSASGKTTIANLLEEREGMKQVQSYTTRPPRFKGETGHRFIEDEKCYELKDIVASTLYNGYWYCATLEQINEADIYVIDVTGAKELLYNHEKINRNIHIIYFDVNVYERINRMVNRGGTDTQIVSRLLSDESFDWYKNLSELGMEIFDNKWWEYTNLCAINANGSTDDVYKEVFNLIDEITYKHQK